MLAALALVGAPGCGEDTEEFKEDYNQAIRPLSALGGDIGASLGGAEGQSDRAIARQFDELADRTERARQNISALDPPEDAGEQFDELLASLRQATADLRAVAASAREGDPAEAADAARALVKTGQRVREAESSLRDAVDG